MSINICGHKFQGPYSDPLQVEDESGMYAVLEYFDDEVRYIDVGEASQLRVCLTQHPRRGQWREHAVGDILFAVRYTPGLTPEERMEFEARLRNDASWPCGPNVSLCTR